MHRHPEGTQSEAKRTRRIQAITTGCFATLSMTLVILALVPLSAFSVPEEAKIACETNSQKCPELLAACGRIDALSQITKEYRAYLEKVPKEVEKDAKTAEHTTQTGEDKKKKIPEVKTREAAYTKQSTSITKTFMTQCKEASTACNLRAQQEAVEGMPPPEPIDCAKIWNPVDGDVKQAEREGRDLLSWLLGGAQVLTLGAQFAKAVTPTTQQKIKACEQNPASCQQKIFCKKSDGTTEEKVVDVRTLVGKDLPAGCSFDRPGTEVGKDEIAKPSTSALPGTEDIAGLTDEEQAAEDAKKADEALTQDALADKGKDSKRKSSIGTPSGIPGSQAGRAFEEDEDKTVPASRPGTEEKGEGEVGFAGRGTGSGTSALPESKGGEGGRLSRHLPTVPRTPATEEALPVTERTLFQGVHEFYSDPSIRGQLAPK